MLTWFLTLMLPFVLAAEPEKYMPPEQIIQEMKEPGHIPQGLKPRMYHKLDDVIPKAAQEKIKQKRKKRKGKYHAKEEVIECKSTLFSCAHAGGKKAPELPGAPIPSPTPIEGDADLPPTVDLRAYDSPVRDQFNGSCTAHALIASMENLLNRTKTGNLLSVRYFWSQYQRYSAFSAIAAATRNYQINDVYWPQASDKPKVNPLGIFGKYILAQQNFLDDDVDAALLALAKGYPVYVAMSVPRDMASCRATIRESSGVTSGGHALLIDGYFQDVKRRKYGILKNSWGTDCGDKGFQYFPFSLCQKDGMYCQFWSVEKVLELDK